jgi:hypothetical protein
MKIVKLIRSVVLGRESADPTVLDARKVTMGMGGPAAEIPQFWGHSR